MHSIFFLASISQVSNLLHASPLRCAFQKKNITLNMATTSKKTYQFPRNQCIACNDIIHEQNHALLLFWSSGEAEKIHLKSENFTGMTLNAEDPYPKICLPCKFKVESAVGFKNLCVKWREAQEENLSHVKSGRRCEAESSSPSLKRMLSAPTIVGAIIVVIQ